MHHCLSDCWSLPSHRFDCLRYHDRCLKQVSDEASKRGGRERAPVATGAGCAWSTDRANCGLERRVRAGRTAAGGGPSACAMVSLGGHHPGILAQSRFTTLKLTTVSDPAGPGWVLVRPWVPPATSCPDTRENVPWHLASDPDVPSILRTGSGGPCGRSWKTWRIASSSRLVNTRCCPPTCWAWVRRAPPSP